MYYIGRNCHLRCFTGFVATIAFVVFHVLLVSPRHCACAEPANSMAPNQSEVRSLEWDLLPRSEVVPVLRMLAVQTKGNYEQIRTWQSSWAVEAKRRVPQVQAMRLRPDLGDVQLMQISQYALDVVVDVGADKIFREKRESTLSWINMDTDKPVEIRKARPADTRVVVTAEECLHFDPNQSGRVYKPVADHPEAQNKRAAFRDAPESPKAASYLAMPDPRRYFGRTGNGKFWEKLGFNVAELEGRGKRGEEGAKAHWERLQIYQAPGPGGIWYREDVVLGAPRNTEDFVRTIWSPQAGYNPIRFDIRKHGSEKQPVMSLEWRFKEVDGIYVPVWANEVTYVDGVFQRSKELTCKDCVLNMPLESGQFTHAALALEDGDLLLDRAQNVCYSMRDGEPEKLADFGEKYVPPGERARLSARRRWVFVTVGIVGLLVAVFVFRARRAKG